MPRKGPKAAGAASPSKAVTGLTALALREENERKVLFRSNKTTATAVLKAVKPTDAATVAEVREIVREAVAPLAKEATVQELKEQVSGMAAILASVSDTLEGVKDDVGAIRGATQDIKKQLRELSRTQSRSSLLAVLYAILGFIWAILKYVWNLLTGTDIGVFLTMILRDVGSSFGPNTPNARIAIFFAFILLVLVHFVRSSIRIKGSVNGKPKFTIAVAALDVYLLVVYIFTKNPTDSETIQLFRTLMQGYLDTAQNYILEMDIFGSVKRFVIASDTYKDLEGFAQVIWEVLKATVFKLIGLIFDTIVSIFKAITCAVTGWFCGGDNELSKVMKTIVKDERVPELLAQFGAITYLMFEKNAKISGESFEQLVSLMEFAFALDTLYSSQLDKVVRRFVKLELTA